MKLWGLSPTQSQLTRTQTPPPATRLCPGAHSHSACCLSVVLVLQVANQAASFWEYQTVQSSHWDAHQLQRRQRETASAETAAKKLQIEHQSQISIKQLQRRHSSTQAAMLSIGRSLLSQSVFRSAAVEEAEKTIQQLNEVGAQQAEEAKQSRPASLRRLTCAVPALCGVQFAAKKVEECDEMEKRKTKFEVPRKGRDGQPDERRPCAHCVVSVLLSAVQKLYKKVADAHQHCLAPAPTIRVEYADENATAQQQQQPQAAAAVQAAPHGPNRRSPIRTSPGAHISPHPPSQLPPAYDSGAHLSGHAGGGYADSDVYPARPLEVQLPRPSGYYYQPQPQPQQQQHRSASLQMEQRPAYAEPRRQQLPMRDTHSAAYYHQQDRSRKGRRTRRTTNSPHGSLSDALTAAPLPAATCSAALCLH